jgi:epoxide hydrolase
MSEALTPFTIDVPPSEIDDLRARLALTRWPEREVVDDWSQGTPLKYLQEVCEYWATEYDWYRVQEHVNQYPQFKTNIDGVEIHLLHIRSPEPQARPLLLTHGWPGSIVEFLKVVEPLTNPQVHGGQASDAFHLVIPALPGYGFSGKPTTTGWSVQKIAEAWDTLMARVGYERYFAQGGDWGAAITTAIGVRQSESGGGCAGIHVNMPLAGPDPATMDDLTDAERDALAATKFYQQWDSGYSKQQSTRPQTIGYSLVDSPAGLAGWILEKFHRWMDCDGHPENVATRDELLDNLMFYWLTKSGASSARLYWESFGKNSGGLITIPSGCSMFPKEIFRTSERWMRKRYQDLVYWNKLDKGGHFAAFERPETYVTEVRACFAKMSLGT